MSASKPGDLVEITRLITPEDKRAFSIGHHMRVREVDKDGDCYCDELTGGDAGDPDYVFVRNQLHLVGADTPSGAGPAPSPSPSPSFVPTHRYADPEEFLGFKTGDLARISHDDGSSCPKWIKADGEERWLSYSRMEPLAPAQEGPWGFQDKPEESDYVEPPTVASDKMDSIADRTWGDWGEFMNEQGDIAQISWRRLGDLSEKTSDRPKASKHPYAIGDKAVITHIDGIDEDVGLYAGKIVTVLDADPNEPTYTGVQHPEKPKGALYFLRTDQLRPLNDPVTGENEQYDEPDDCIEPPIVTSDEMDAIADRTWGQPFDPDNIPKIYGVGVAGINIEASLRVPDGLPGYHLLELPE